jgi:hypothetical protein
MEGILEKLDVSSMKYETIKISESHEGKNRLKTLCSSFSK